MELSLSRQAGFSMPRLFLYLTAAIVLVVLLNFIAPFYLESRPNSSNSASPSLRQEFVVKDSAASNSDATDEELHKYDLSKIDGDGRNNIIVNTNSSFDILQTGVNPMKAMLLQTQFNEYNYRNKYDLIVPSMYSLSTAKASEFSPVFSPARRKYFISFLGQVNEEADDDSSTKNSNTDLQVVVKDALLKLVAKHSRAAYNEFLFDFDCDEKTKQLCENQTIILLDSTFTIIMPTASHSSQSFLINPIIYDNQLNSKIMNAFVTGAIPILVGGDFISLPFNEAIDWDRALIRIPTAHITELYVVLKTFTDSDIIEMRRFGSNIYHNYFSDLKQLVDTIVALFRFNRLKIPSPPAANEHSEFYLNQSKFDQNLLSNQSDLTQSASFYRPKIYSDDEENVGPLELGQLGEGAGGSGREFSEALGGNFMSEQFTIVILTYERENILLSALQRLKDLPYLNKVIVVWNSPNPPTPGIKWPEIGVDILVIKSKHNSLNNRFLPFEEIKTDAVLSMDDDASFRHDEIIFAFRVWREARDRIVGFPARYHAWDAAHSTWLYNSNYTCEFSMILTGAAFYHKYYSYLYTHWMPAAIRNKVDEYMNCEDIAMNFLVSHVSRLPPIKVTSRWTFRCPECSSSLSEDDRHYQRRHRCLNYFASVYGYMPLLYTQFRADSVLFKTRIPHDKQKCFKFI
ncbi:Exostoses (Multiple)-like 3 [Tyrophagus putrescentiae]|nr:Exostoses (Multiple)-like 3 [Tyrophagus putrescentiae]